MVKVNYIIKRHKPMCDTPYGLITYHKGSLFIYNNNKFEKIVKVNKSITVRLIERMNRNEPKSAVYIDDFVFLALDNCILKINLITKKIENLFEYRKKGIHTSRLLSIKNIDGFSQSIAYGEYFDNPRKEKVCILSKSASEKTFKVVYEFSSGVVRHIHSLVPDTKNNCIYILTGDSDNESGIWKATDNFKKVEKLKVGNQDYRACIAFANNNSILFATDIPSRDNYINYFDLKNNEIRKIEKISGSCTTGCSTKNFFIFGASYETVEPKKKNRIEKIKYLLSTKRASGIKDNYVRLYTLDVNYCLKELISYKKDIFPVGLFQFGRINVIYSETFKGIFIYPQAVIKYDGMLGFIPLDYIIND